MSTPALRLAWCALPAARYACEHWHYSGRVPRGRLTHLGVWEDGRFIGAVVFGHGATRMPAHSVGLSQWEACELQRVALRAHRTPVSRIVAIAVRLLHHLSPGLRAVISYADPVQGHVGGIYQAAGWVYTGLSAGGTEYLWRGRWVHSRAIGHTSKRFGMNRALLAAGKRTMPGKHRYVLPFDGEMRRRLLPLALPYPKAGRASGESDTPPIQGGEGAAMRPHGSTPDAAPEAAG